MSYVDVVLDRPTNQPLTYRLTPETLLTANPGSLLEVPVGNRRAYAIVTRRVRSVGDDLRDKVRPIGRVLQATWASKRSIALAAAMATYSGESLGTCLFRILPPVGKRAGGTARQPAARLDGSMLHAYGGHQQRRELYLQLIQRSHAIQRQIILIAPTQRHAWLEESISALGLRVKTVTAELAPTKQRTVAHDVATGLIDVLIGTRHVVGWPAYALGLLIIDDPLHQSHRDDQRPHLDSATIAELRHHVDGGHSLLGLSGPVPAALLREQSGLAQRITVAQTPATLRFVQPVGLSTISPSVLDVLHRALDAGQPTAIVAPRHGMGGQVRCADCDHPLLCPACQHELNPQASQSMLECPNCQTKAPWPTSCPDCQGMQLRSWGIGDSAIRQWLQRHHSDLLAKGLVVGTEGLFESTQIWGAVYFRTADSPLAAPDLMRPLRYVHAIAEAMNSSQVVIVETRDASQPLLAALTHPTGLQPLLDERRALNLPPYTRTLRLSGPLGSQEALQRAIAPFALGSWTQRQTELIVSIHLPAAQLLAAYASLKTALGRAWTIRVDSVLDHATSPRGMMHRQTLVRVQDSQEAR